ncbi:hypothetical protein [Nocardia heshunensis]
MSEKLPSGVVFDRAALIEFAHQGPYALAIAFAVVDLSDTLIVPATALAEARAHVPVDRLPVLEVLLDLPTTVVIDLDRTAAWTQVGAVLAAAPQIPDGLSAAHVVVAGVGRDYPVVTDRGPVLQTLDPRVAVDELP